MDLHDAAKHKTKRTLACSFQRHLQQVHSQFVTLDLCSLSDHEVRAAKFTNRWNSGCWWKRDAQSDEHLVGTKCLSVEQFADNRLDWRKVKLS